MKKLVKCSVCKENMWMLSDVYYDNHGMCKACWDKSHSSKESPFDKWAKKEYGKKQSADSPIRRIICQHIENESNFKCDDRCCAWTYCCTVEESIRFLVYKEAHHILRMIHLDRIKWIHKEDEIHSDISYGKYSDIEAILLADKIADAILKKKKEDL